LVLNLSFESIYCRARGISIIIVMIIAFYSFIQTPESSCVE